MVDIRIIKHNTAKGTAKYSKTLSNIVNRKLRDADIELKEYIEEELLGRSDISDIIGAIVRAHEDYVYSVELLNEATQEYKIITDRVNFF